MKWGIVDIVLHLQLVAKQEYQKNNTLLVISYGWYTTLHMPKKVKIYIVWGFPLSLNIPCLYHIIPSLSGFICNEYYNGNLVYALEPLYYIHTCIVTHQSTYKSVMVYMCPHIYRTRALS